MHLHAHHPFSFASLSFVIVRISSRVSVNSFRSIMSTHSLKEIEMLSAREWGGRKSACCCRLDHERSVSISHSALIMSMRTRTAALILRD